jgi:hypothetical protein
MRVFPMHTTLGLFLHSRMDLLKLAKLTEIYYKAVEASLKLIKNDTYEIAEENEKHPILSGCPYCGDSVTDLGNGKWACWKCSKHGEQPLLTVFLSQWMDRRGHHGWKSFETEQEAIEDQETYNPESRDGVVETPLTTTRLPGIEWNN